MAPESSVVVETAGDETADEWDRYVAAAPSASIYHRHGWQRLFRGLFRKECHYLLARQGGAIVGILPLVQLKSRLFGNFLVSVPYFNHGGVVADSDAVRDKLLAHAAGLAGRLGVSHIEFRHSTPDCGDLPARTDKVSMLLDLPAGADALWKQIGSKLRAQIKRPGKEGATSVSGGAELLDEFYAVFSENMRDLGTPVYPRSFFTFILDLLPDAARIFVVRLGQAPVAAGLVIGHRDVLEIPWASSLRKANAAGVNMLLYWSVLEHACQSGFRVFDFGRSTTGSGPHRFKQQWGASERQLHWHYWLRGGGELPRLNPSNPRYAAAIAVWRRLPLAVANRVGPLLVGNLP